MKYYLICGERSGDLHASNLALELKKKDPNAEFRFVGGDQLVKAVGKEGLFMHYDEVSYMLITQVLANLLKITKRIGDTASDILKFKPDVLILVDFSGFNLRVASKVKPTGIPIHYYISPKIWAWNQKRVHKIKKLIDEMYVIMPFEKDFYKTYDFDVHYVGNPIMDAVSEFKPDNEFKQKNALDSRPIIAILPGSRRQEVRSTLGLMLLFARTKPEYQFVVAGVPNLPKEYYEPCIKQGFKMVIDQTYDLLSFSHAAIVTSGTATLETALFEVPQIVVYDTNAITYFLAKQVLKIKHISLVNLIADKPLVKELIYKDFNLKSLQEEFEKITNEESRTAVLEGYKQLKNTIGSKGASENCANLIISRLNNI